MAAINSDLLEQVDQLLSRPNQVWLTGAGISKDAGLPLMGRLTTRVLQESAGKLYEQILKDLLDELPENAHIEHVLSQLGDYTTLADRSRSKEVIIKGKTYNIPTLEDAHNQIAVSIANVIRWGDKEDGADKWTTGTRDKPVVSIDQHLRFVRALFGRRQAGLSERRKPLHIFTTNYDTLIEDALSLAHLTYWDGFYGGAIAFRAHRFGKLAPESGYRAIVVKLHGSIDWFLSEDGSVLRVRDSDAYPPNKGRVLIYPQATKYVATQRDPFASQFSLFRQALATGENVLAICGYSFGDDHINQEIELALSSKDNKTTLVAFCLQGNGLPSAVQSWLASDWGKRVYVLTERGLYAGKQGPLFPPKGGGTHNWWKFDGMTAFLESGKEGVE
ncbi:SIR2 family protein [Dyella sp. EPa41]|uniref:SIR2 family protein n=1 Tax=Dyella sp. EPa41 TaxID=1561194 RepID=UPI0019168DAC|nr:SIR2 family protein [Dyella sp. EPa41]